MKRRDIEKTLKNEAKQHTPDVYDKILLSAKAQGLLPQETEVCERYDQGNAAVLSKNKRHLLTGIVALFAAVLVCLAVFLPLLKGVSAPVSPTNIVLSTNDVYGMGAVSTVKLLGSDTSAQAIRKLSSVKCVAALDDTTSEEEVKSQAEKFNEYFTALDSFMGEEIVTTVSEANQDEKYPYEMKLTINSKNFDGESVQNVMYFTETLLESSDEDDDEEEEGESKYILEGVMVVDGLDYHLEGERSIEKEEDETENELKIRAYADVADKTSYVEMEQEHSAESGESETEYVYSIYSNGTLIEQTAVEFETEKEGTKEEVEYSLEFRQGEVKGKYVIERETENGKVQIKVEYDIDGKQGEFHVALTSDHKYSYRFSDGTTLVF